MVANMTEWSECVFCVSERSGCPRLRTRLLVPASLLLWVGLPGLCMHLNCVIGRARVCLCVCVWRRGKALVESLDSGVSLLGGPVWFLHFLTM